MSAFLGEEPLAVMGEAVHGYVLLPLFGIVLGRVWEREREREREYQADAGTVRLSLWLPFAQSQMLKL